MKFAIVLLYKSLSTIFMLGQSSTQEDSKITLCIMRHGMAENMAKNDASRQLVSFGEEQARNTSCWFSQHYPKIKIDLALVSPYTRAEQTYNICLLYTSPSPRD